MILVLFVSVSIGLQGSFTLLVAVLKRSMQAPQILSDFCARGPVRATSESTSKAFRFVKVSGRILWFSGGSRFRSASFAICLNEILRHLNLRRIELHPDRTNAELRASSISKDLKTVFLILVTHCLIVMLEFGSERFGNWLCHSL